MSQQNNIIDPLIRELMESAATGEAVKMFLQSDLGRHITNKAANEVDEALADLVDIDPHNYQLIAATQMRVKVPAQAITWLTDAIAEGDNAMSRLHEDS